MQNFIEYIECCLFCNVGLIYLKVMWVLAFGNYTRKCNFRHLYLASMGQCNSLTNKTKRYRILTTSAAIPIISCVLNGTHWLFHHIWYIHNDFSIKPVASVLDAYADGLWFESLVMYIVANKPFVSLLQKVGWGRGKLLAKGRSAQLPTTRKHDCDNCPPFTAVRLLVFWLFSDLFQLDRDENPSCI